MKEDLEFVKEKELTTEIFLHDSRRKMKILMMGHVPFV